MYFTKKNLPLKQEITGFYKKNQNYSIHKRINLTKKNQKNLFFYDELLPSCLLAVQCLIFLFSDQLYNYMLFFKINKIFLYKKNPSIE
jgi:RAB protein geranylgeranyltransferase component A